MIIHIQIKKNARAGCDEHSFLFEGIGEIKGGDISEPGKKRWTARLQIAYFRHPNAFSAQRV